MPTLIHNAAGPARRHPLMPDTLQSSRSRRLFQGLLLAGYAGLVSALSLLPPSAFQRPARRFAFLIFPHMDKVAHVFMYAGMSALLCWCWNPPLDRGVRNALLILILVTAYGLIMELLQQWMARGRTFELADNAANLVGGTAGILCWATLHARRRLAPYHG